MPNKQRMKEIEDIIINFIENNKDNYHSLSDLASQIPISKSERKYLKNILNKLSRNSSIIRRGKMFTAKPDNQPQAKSVTGIFDATSLVRGYSYAFVNHEDGDILIDSEDIGSAVHNDRVLVELKYRRRGLLYGSIKEVVERANTTFTGNIEKYQSRYIFTPDLRKVHISFDISELNGAAEGDKVIVRVVNWGQKSIGSKPSVVVTEKLGKAGDKEVEELAVFKQFNLPLDFPEQVKQELSGIEDYIDGDEINNRLDLRDLTTFTIDPPTAKDYDDAISLEMITSQEDDSVNTETYRLYVHIADVSYYVPLGSALFNEASERGNSFYFPRRVVPMLPEKISNKICSLRPDEDKLTITVITEFDATLNIIRQSVRNTIIRSGYRLNYDEVDQFFDGDAQAVPEELTLTLSKLRIISEKMTRKRYENGYIPFNLPELEVEFDDEGKISRLVRSKETDSHKLVENCMLLANNYVGSLLAKNTKEAVYRVHEEPDEEKFLQMLDLLHHYKISSPKSHSMQKMVQNLLLSMPTPEHHRVFDYLILRTMKKARYDTIPIGHFGLAAKNYTHFTSPIRRICDLTVHHLLRLHVMKTNSPAKEKGSSPSLSEIAAKASSQEILADSAEREMEVVYKRLYMKDKIGELYEGLVVNLSNSMISVELNDIPVLGYVPIVSLKGDYFRLNADFMELTGKKRGKRIRLMDKVVVQVDRIDFDVLFTLIKIV